MIDNQNDQEQLTFDQVNTADNDCQDIEESLAESLNKPQTHNTDINTNNHLQGEGFFVKGSVSMVNEDFVLGQFPQNKEEVGYHLAMVLDDEENIAWYQKLARDRRSDFLMHCLKIVIEAFNRKKITKKPPQYFAGVVKNRTEQQERLEAYKRKAMTNHTTFINCQKEKNER